MILYLLDTDIVIYVIKRRPPEVLLTFTQQTGRMAIQG
jgi:tRNA(fMet)-specific endonuclease VapC